MKLFLPILMLTLPTLMFGCSDNSTNSEEEEQENEKTSTNYVSEVYYLTGTEIDRDPDCFPCTVEFEYTYDTTWVATVASMKYLVNIPDSLQFFGLNGANSGRKSAFPQNCRESDALYEYCAYASYNNGLITLDLFRSGYLYEGEGSLQNDELQINGLFKYRGDSVGYDLSGQKIEGLGGLGDPEYPHTGLYFVGGEKRTTSYSAWPIPDGEVPEVETERVEFSIHLKVQDDRETIRFAGLHGADAGEMENRVYPDCMNSEDCIVMGQSTGTESFEIDIENNGRTYTATGNARSTDFQLNAQYQYQNITIDYDLDGQMYIE
jgi:hypothetical protein